jgi:peptidoglycan/xylan/chitin deacetylase (PgdA/CDA1 family)
MVRALKTIVKQVTERALIASGIAAIARRSTRAGTLIVAYHNVVPDGHDLRGDSSLHLPQRRFASQLDALGRLGDVVGLETIDGEASSERPRFVVTFDDAYTGALTAGVEELRRRGMPATVFVAPGLLGLTPWWDLLANATTGAIDESARNHALTVLAGRRDAVIQWAGARVATGGADHTPVIATREQLRDALTYDGLTAGSHTWSHPNLTALTQADLKGELRSSAEWLRAEFPTRYIPWLTYPYGLTSAAVEQSARSAGYVGALRVDGGWMNHRNASDRFALPRLNVPRGVSEAGFTLRLSGIAAR